MLGTAPDLLDPLLYGEQRGFAGVFDYRHNYPIEQFAAPLDNICVTEGNGVKTAWIDCNHELGPTGRVREWERGRVGEGERERGRVGERGGESGRVGEGESGRGGNYENLP